MYTLLRQLTICLAVCWLPRIAAGPAIVSPGHSQLDMQMTRMFR